MKNVIKHNHYYGILIFVFSLLLGACNKYLDVQSNKNQVVPKDLIDLQQILDGAQNINLNFCAIGEVSADDYFLKQRVFDGLSEEGRMFYLWQNPVYNFNNDWAKAYIPVYSCNLVLDKLKEIERTALNSDDWNNVKGSALFYRASQYLSLVWTYSKAFNEKTSSADLGIVLRESSDFNVKSERSTVSKCYRVILRDLSEAVELLPEQAIHSMRPSKLTAYGALARTYLSMAKYDSAYYFADKVLSAKHELLDFNDATQIDMKSSYPLVRFNKETLGYFELVTINAQIGVNYATVDTNLYQSYQPDDLRKLAFFKMNTDGYVSFKGSYSGSANLFGGLALDEMFLIRAECLVRLGDVKRGLADIDYLLTHRYKTGTYLASNFDNKDKALDFVLEERRKELLFRGLRWMDLKRLNEEGRQIYIKRVINGKEYVLRPGDNRYAIPLPEDVVRTTGIPQNPF
ncbi:RagB/SusD family nutrient uptake outer membrane protein [Sphingobacterium thalpophilum]|uniref:RagB/SusD family nutrient uptake outer membrane protein n=1 Tax=Sphingobacterium thalpophilum TaxID=259 RepID=UPI002D775CA3|nr:RagB/SusD family nutrient uptake outer membrane protein [Sphingobacterium thalpophilum]